MAITYAQALENAISVIVDAETKEKLVALKAQLEKKRSSSSSKPTKIQLENEKIKANILEVLTDEGQTVSEILPQLDGTLSSKPLTNQRISALLKQLVDGKSVTKVIDKKTSLFSLA
jgi:hypothetical protein